jgi:hypothetical protein
VFLSTSVFQFEPGGDIITSVCTQHTSDELPDKRFFVRDTRRDALQITSEYLDVVHLTHYMKTSVCVLDTRRT